MPYKSQSIAHGSHGLMCWWESIILFYVHVFKTSINSSFRKTPFFWHKSEKWIVYCFYVGMLLTVTCQLVVGTDCNWNEWKKKLWLKWKLKLNQMVLNCVAQKKLANESNKTVRVVCYLLLRMSDNKSKQLKLSL